VLDIEFQIAKEIQRNSIGLKNREIEQAIIATFLHSQPIDQKAKTRDLYLLIGQYASDTIELNKGLIAWAQNSYWLDDTNTNISTGTLPSSWRLGNKPNLNQMHSNQTRNISSDVVLARLLDEIPRVKALTSGASAAKVKVHTLSKKPNDIEDDGDFHFAILLPSAASESNKPSTEAIRFIEETTGPDKPRVYRNAVILLVPSREGLDVANNRIRDYLAWELVQEEVKQQSKDGIIDPARAQTLRINIDSAKGRISEAIRQAYCIVVTVSEKDEIIAFKISISDDQHFNIIKADKRSRIQDTAISADAILPGGPYDFWKKDEVSRRVKDLTGSFAQLPHLPKMLQAKAIIDTLVDGCEQGYFVLRLQRPDKSVRTWWMQRPDDVALSEPGLELWLSESAELAEVAPELLGQKRLPELWQTDQISVRSIIDYFIGGKVVQKQKNGFTEPIHVPKANREVVERTIGLAVEKEYIWLISGPSSIWGEAVPFGVLNDAATLSSPPSPVQVTEVLSESLPNAWKDGNCTALSLATALSQKVGKTLPWKFILNLLSASLRARFLELVDASITWPCEFANAQHAQFKMAAPGTTEGIIGTGVILKPNVLITESELDSHEIQNLGDNVAKLFEIKAKRSTPIKISIRVEIGDGKTQPQPQVVEEFNKVLQNVKDGLKIS
jgi:hypothetical protein